MKFAKQVKSKNARTMTRFWGHKCEEFYAGCCLCEAWKVYEGTGRVPEVGDARIIAAQNAMHARDAAEAQTETL